MFKITIGQLKELIRDVSDDVVLYNERIEDVYFQEHGWSTTRIKGEFWSCEEINVYPINTITLVDDKLVFTGHY